MRKFLCCLLAVLTLYAGTVTNISCGGNSPTSSTSSVSENATLSLKKKIYSLEDSKTAELKIEFTVDGAEGDRTALTFTSDKPTVATVSDDGMVTGVSAGTAHVTISYKELSVEATIKVTQREYKLTLSDTYLILPINGEKEVTATAYYGVTELTDAALSWSSSNPEVATIENGKITAVSSGNAEITVKYENLVQSLQVSVVSEATEAQVNTFSEEYINIYGRSYLSNGQLNLDHAANGVEVGIIGTELKMTMYSLSAGYMRVFIDGSAAGSRMAVSAGENDYTVAVDLEEGYHLIRIVKCTEEQQNAHWDICSFQAEKFFAAPKKSELKIEFIGDSITAGHGSIGYYGQPHTIDNSDATRAYAYLTAQALNADYSIVAWSGICVSAYHWLKHLNMATLYDMVSYQNRQAYAFDFEADIVVLNLGTNEDSFLNTSEGTSYGAQFSADYQAFLQTLRQRHPNAYIICLYGMGGRGPIIHIGIQTAIENLADDKIVYNPFEITSDSSGGNNHPSSAAHQTWAKDLTAYIRTLL